MVRRTLLAAGVLLLCVLVSARRPPSGDPARPDLARPPQGPRYYPFCYCRPGYVWRPFPSWPFCKCYKFVRDVASWAEARVYCHAMRANMMEVRDSQTQSWLQGQLYARKDRGHHLLEKPEYWLGATDLEQEGTWVWDPSYTNVGPRYWLYREPNNYLSYQNCMAIKERSLNSRTYGWFDDDCYEKKFYICERSGWYCWGWTCWRRYSSGPKAMLPRSVAEAKKASVARPAAPAAEKVSFEA